ncbi:FAD-binding oxidoreductase, partial [bacterium]|nr:FAD-binding oxidoreductase [bacterium]
MPIYLKWLMDRFQKLGGLIEKIEVNDFSKLPSEFNVIVNCTGLNSGKLFSDPEVYPVRGQIIRIKPIIDEMHLDQQVPTLAYIVPRSNDMILGGVAQENNWNVEPIDEDRNFILDKCSKIIPELKDAEIIEDIVGLRPGRTEVRLDKEIISDKIVIHNYGHGGSGVTLSWGCAEEVVEIVNE